MCNVLKVSHQEAIRSLYQKGWSQRRIGRELGINRRTVRRYVEEEAKCTSIRPRLGEPGGKVHHHFDPRRGECRWEAAGGLGCRTMGPPEPV